jgi:hypothetical protein
LLSHCLPPLDEQGCHSAYDRNDEILWLEVTLEQRLYFRHVTLLLVYLPVLESPSSIRRHSFSQFLKPIQDDAASFSCFPALQLA